MRSCWIVAGALALIACSPESASTADTDQACELLTVEKQIGVPPPATGTSGRSIGSSFTDFVGDPPSNATVYVAVAHVDELGAVADEVAGLKGVEIVEVVDQDAAYEHFEELFSDSPVMSTVDPSILPASVRVYVATDADLDALVAWGRDDDRLQEILDVRETGAVILSTVARSFADELNELGAIAEGDLKAAIELIRSKDRPTFTDLSATSDAISEFMTEHCSDP